MASKADVEWWKGLAGAAVSGKWYVAHGNYESGIERRKFGRSRHVWMGYDSAFPSNETLEFIAASRTAVPEMADMLARAAALLRDHKDTNGPSWHVAIAAWLADWNANDDE